MLNELNSIKEVDYTFKVPNRLCQYRTKSNFNTDKLGTTLFYVFVGTILKTKTDFSRRYNLVIATSLLIINSTGFKGWNARHEDGWNHIDCFCKQSSLLPSREELQQRLVKSSSVSSMSGKQFIQPVRIYLVRI